MGVFLRNLGLKCGTSCDTSVVTCKVLIAFRNAALQTIELLFMKLDSRNVLMSLLLLYKPLVHIEASLPELIDPMVMLGGSIASQNNDTG